MHHNLNDFPLGRARPDEHIPRTIGMSAEELEAHMRHGNAAEGVIRRIMNIKLQSGETPLDLPLTANQMFDGIRAQTVASEVLALLKKEEPKTGDK